MSNITAAASGPSSNQQPAAQHTPEQLLVQLSLEEKCAMLHGRDKWEISGCERLGIPDWTVSDGPAGVRGRQMAAGLMLPAAIALAASWDAELLAEAGAALALESKDRKIQMLLAPTVNIQRLPTWGRAFESYSEDPLLTSQLAVAFIKALQAGGIGACVKHFVANEQETDRFVVSSELDERTLREVYLAPFEAAVLEADAKAVMGSYNRVNGELTCESQRLLEAILRREWGFGGVVVSDWSALQNTVEPLEAGVNLDMPGGGYWANSALVDLVNAGQLEESLIDQRLLDILRFLEWAGRLQGKSDHHEEVVVRPEHAKLARKAAAAGTVLIHNRRGLLPLQLPASATPETALPGAASTTNTPASIALIGPHSLRPCPGGGGAAQVGQRYSQNLAEALRQNLSPSVGLSHAPGLSLDRSAPALPANWLTPNLTTLELHKGRNLEGKPLKTLNNMAVEFQLLDDTWPDPDWDYVSVRQRLTITPDVGGKWHLCGGGASEVQLWLDGRLVADSQVDGFSLGPGFYGASGVVELTAGATYELVVEHTSRQQHQRIVGGNIFAKPVSAEEQDLAEAAEAAGRADVAIVVVGTTPHWEAENFDRPTLALPGRQDELVLRCLAANPNTVVVINSGSPVLMPWLEQAGAVLCIWFPGQEGAAALADVLCGLAEPSGRSPITWPSADEDMVAWADVPATFPGVGGKVHYTEGVLVGHRWFDRHQIEPAVPFGHGGSYTEFHWEAPSIAGDFPNLVVEVSVANIGEQPGSETVQCYVSQDAGSASSPDTASLDPASAQTSVRPPQWLVGFAKLHLAPGETAKAEIQLNPRSFSYWDTQSHSWQIPKAAFQIHLSRSCADRVFTLATHS